MAVTTADWTDPIACPFCGDELASPGAGFVDHIHESATCEAEFEFWRENISDDVAGEWAG
ncbi:uncharacterized protein Nmag_3501 [Natrialba magadii ATCC 43099]|uniref:Uncharacterized protein n=1 Tax=Natrialba magadii (strain ATCC 43099 / DSM 3394 / CCM 3739 / CIP 104546 / IAM 13178 / JCM 8861 / NBRC 102185 / NCIMB 2190 / MS3) TaxID=547559 RepID=D3STW2_NATMM|nr:hypothetical protein [Natrialba magadii]ADD07051.1 uncharacterized protein Nmag_3501 [Natrialba magadii ATCC 43099]ELY28806.1 hypothetical protein C500_12710 [Natrialba magadii ATCC 43099]